MPKATKSEVRRHAHRRVRRQRPALLGRRPHCRAGDSRNACLRGVLRWPCQQPAGRQAARFPGRALRRPRHWAAVGPELRRRQPQRGTRRRRRPVGAVRAGGGRPGAGQVRVKGRDAVRKDGRGPAQHQHPQPGHSGQQGGARGAVHRRTHRAAAVVALARPATPIAGAASRRCRRRHWINGRCAKSGSSNCCARW